ncbi:FecR family protein [Burkholderia alba]|uniref:FecR family protein n=1 Tax=Burkholderia alba TaxID=2683677 RepID=UPI002B05AE2C|nr:FecR domain-containing protein [Burkholderia alba]
MTKANLEAASEEQDQARAWLLRLRSEKACTDDVRAFQRWCDDHPGGAHLLRDTWSSLRTAASEIAREERDAGRAWTGGAVRAAALRPGRRAFVGFAVAAGASWLALRPPLQLWPALGEFAADYRTGIGEQRRVALSERVVVELNTQTRLNVLSSSRAARGVELVAGEAEIVAAAPAAGRVEPIRPVSVIAGRGRLQANVARFDVRRIGDEVCVTCLSGSVEVEHPARRMTLLASQQIVYDDRKVRAVAGVDPGAVIAWRRGVLVFNGVPVSQVVDEINRYRPGKVILRNASLGENRVQAQCPIAKLNNVIDMLGQLYGARITRLPGNIVVLS